MVTQWDVFISHAFEDKDSFVRPLAEALRQLGVSVWYDEFSLQVGDSLSRGIDHGIIGSKFGVVVISRAFIGKNWPEHELRGLVNRDVEDDFRILPIWHGVTKAEVKSLSPSLADKIAVDTNKDSAEEAALKLLRVVRRDLYDAHPRAMLEAIVTGEAIDQLQDEIDQLHDELIEYRCPYCRASLSTRETIDYDQKNSGLVDTFECGYATGGFRERPCPFGPKFPHLEDYDLQITVNEEESSGFRYTCHTFPKTDAARCVDLRTGYGRTADEAREFVIEHYNYLTTPPHQPFRGKWISRS
jgi:hypothetical protein